MFWVSWLSLYCMRPVWLVGLFLFITVQFLLRHSLTSLRILGCILFLTFIIETFFLNWIWSSLLLSCDPSKSFNEVIWTVVAYHLPLTPSKSVFFYVFPSHCLITTKGSRYFGLNLVDDSVDNARVLKKKLPG